MPTLPYRQISPDASREEAPRVHVYVAPGTSESPLFLVLAAVFERLVAFVKGRRHSPRGNARRITLRVEGGELSVQFGARDAVVAPLDRLLNVELDSRAVHRTQTSVRPDGTMRGVGSVLVDESRIRLIFSDRDGALALGEGFGSYSEQLESMAKVRAFLRRQGWIPEDERA